MARQLGTKTISGVYAVLATDDGYILKANTGAGAVTVNLPTIATLPANSVRIIVIDDNNNAGTNNITINAFAGEFINGVASFTLNSNGTGTIIESLDTDKWLAQIVEGGDLTGAVPITKGGTGQITQQLAINALAGAVTTGTFLRGNGVNNTMSAIQVADVPTLNQNTTGTASNVTGIVAIANGGTAAATASLARTNLVVPSFYQQIALVLPAATATNVTHSLNTTRPVVQVYNNATNRLISVTVDSTGLNSINLTASPGVTVDVIVIG